MAIPFFLNQDCAGRAYYARLDADPIKRALAWVAFGECSVPGIGPIDDDVAREYEEHDLRDNSIVIYDAIGECWLVVCRECGFVVRTHHGGDSIDGGIGDDDAAELQEYCDPDNELRRLVAEVLVTVDLALHTMPRVILTDAERQTVYDLLGQEL